MRDRTVTKQKALLAAVISHTFWGFSFMASRTALGEASVFLVLSHRFLLSFLLMTPLKLLRFGEDPAPRNLPPNPEDTPQELPTHPEDATRKKPLWPLILLGIFQPVLYFLGEQYGILHSSTIFSGVMIALIPIVAALAATLLLKEKLSLRQFLFSLLSFGGVIGVGLLTKNSGSLDWIGVLGLLVAVFSAVAYLLLSRRLAKDYPPFVRAYSMITVAAAVFTVLALIDVKGDLAAYVQPLANGDYLLSLLFLAICCSVVGFFLSNYMVTGLTVAQAAIFANLTTALSVMAGALLLHEPFSLTGLLCCILILVGIYGATATKEE